MALQKLYYVYGFDTACFYTDEENEVEKRKEYQNDHGKNRR